MPRRDYSANNTVRACFVPGWIFCIRIRILRHHTNEALFWRNPVESFDPDTLIVFGSIVAIVAISSYFGFRNRQARQSLIEKMLDKGQTISPELLESISRSKPRRSPLASAITLIFIGIALAAFFWALGGGSGHWKGEDVPYWLPVVGAFPFAIGLARLTAMIFEKRKDQ
jgi:hypothetical protein